MNIETIAIHAGCEPDPMTGALAPPIHLSTTFEHGPATEILHGYTYVRDENPTQDRLEAALAQLECPRFGVPGRGLAQIEDPSTRPTERTRSGSASSSDAERPGALAFASGMGAAVAMLQTLEPGAHVIFPEDVYVHVRVAERQYAHKWQLAVSVVDTTSVDAVARAIRPETKLVWLETPSNPRMDVADIKAIVKAVEEKWRVVTENSKGRSLTPSAEADGVRDDSHRPLILVDNTFATPVLQRPLELGADVSLHSTTKYCGGHSDVQGGALVLKSKGELYKKLYQTRMVLGAVQSPFNAWLVLRGLRTLPLRMERHSANAMAVAKALEASPKIERVFYPGLPSHAGHEVAKKQMRGFGGMLSVLVKGGWDEAVSVASKVRLWRNATSLGGVESLIEHRASAEGKGTTAPPNLLRLSTGLEHADDLVADLMQALA